MSGYVGKHHTISVIFANFTLMWIIIAMIIAIKIVIKIAIRMFQVDILYGEYQNIKYTEYQNMVYVYTTLYAFLY